MQERLVSCIMVTKPGPDRFPRLRGRIAEFLQQSYKPCELVITLDPRTDHSEQPILDHVTALGRESIRIVRPKEVASLGALRNHALRAARGEVVCVFDDDDFYHPERVARQLAFLDASGKPACCLEDAMQFFENTRELFWLNWRQTPARGVPNTVMFRRVGAPTYIEDGPLANGREDLVFVEAFNERGDLAFMAGAPHLYVYVIHGNNLTTVEHLRMLADRLALSSGLLRRREQLIRDGLSPFDFGRGQVTVIGSNGPAFVLKGDG